MKYTFEKVKVEADKFQTRKEFQTKARPFYAAAHRNGWLSELCSHMTIQKKFKWLEHEIIEEAKKYDTKVSFEKGSRGAYKAALHAGIINHVCKHMHRPKVWNKQWSEESIKQEAFSHKNRKEWRAKSPGSYSAAFRLGILRSLVVQMRKPDAWNKYWTYELAIAEIKSYKSRTEFQRNGSGAYDFLQSQSLLEKAYEDAGLKAMSGTSLQEQEVFEWVKYICPDVVSHFRLDNGKQLDIYIPSLKIGIEFCGIYWHSEEFLENSYHKQKMLAARRQGIRLITMFDYEWLDRNAQVKGFLSSILMKSETVVYARKCQIREISKSQGKEFLNSYHIQGGTNSIVYFGLFYKDELIGVMSGGRHHRAADKQELILDRLCFKANTLIVGGPSKLLNALIEYARANNYPVIKSWSDNRWSEGNVYGKMGFTKTQELGADYFYSKRGSPTSKQSMKKKPNEKSSGKTEHELRLLEGYFRVWDCGKIQWTLIP